MALAAIRDREWRRTCSFLLTAAAVSFLLANHHWFITPRQPIHFTRGYIWTPLWLTGLPMLARVIEAIVRQPRAWAVVCGSLLSLVIVSDNVGFLGISARRALEIGFTLSAEERAAFEAISAIQGNR